MRFVEDDRMGLEVEYNVVGVEYDEGDVEYDEVDVEGGLPLIP